MTPIPDPPPAAPLTTEEIDREVKRIMGALCYELDRTIVDDVYVRVTALIEQARAASHAALRDRLARAEAEREGLRALMNEWEHQGSTRSIQYRDDLCERWLTALATPTDGTARAGDELSMLE